MVGITHAIGGASTVLGAHYLLPEIFPLSVWIILLSFFAAQGPDIDIKRSRIGRNIYIRPFIFFLRPFIDWHRAKQTHSIFWTLFFMAYTIPFIYIFWVGGWFLLWLAYFSHLFLDYFNPTGIKIFYVPFLNPNPRAWSLYSTIPQLAYEVPFLLKKLRYLFDQKKRKGIQRKRIKFDGVWVLTGQKPEKIIASGLWVLFFVLIVVNIKELKDVLLAEGIWLSVVFPLTIMILINTILENRALIRKNPRVFQLFFILGVIPFVGAYLWNIDGYFTYLRDANFVTSLIFVAIITLIPLLYFIGKNLYKEVLAHPSMLFWGKEPKKEFFDYTIFSQLTLMLLLISSIYSLEAYDQSMLQWVDFYNNIESTESLGRQALEVIKNSYTENITTLTEWYLKD